MTVFFDTNLWFSALVFGGIPKQAITRCFMRRDITIVITPFVLEELKENLISKANFDYQAAIEVMHLIKQTCLIIPNPQIIKKYIYKKSDNLIVNSAIAAKADYLVSGDKKHILPLQKCGQVKIVSAKGFLKVLAGKN